MKNNSDNIIDQLNFCVIDLEATGGNLKSDKVIEIGLIKLNGKKISDQKSYLINPEIPIPHFIQRLTKITENDVKQSPTIEEVIDDIVDFIGEDIIVAHNINFDIPFLNSVLKRLKRKPLKNNILCTEVMTKYLIPEITHSNLGYLCEIFKIKHQQAHRAIYDAHSTSMLLIKYLNVFEERHIKKVNQIYYPRNKFELDKVHYRKEDLSKEQFIKKVQSIQSPYIVQFKGEQGDFLDTILGIANTEKTSHLEKSFNDLAWHSLTIKQTGSHFESLIKVCDYVSRLPQDQRIYFISKVISEDLSIEELSPNSEDEQILKSMDDIAFIIYRHLLTDQYYVLNLCSISKKSTLVIKNPSHRKKLDRFMDANIKKTKPTNKKHLTNLFQSWEMVQTIHRAINCPELSKELFVVSRKDFKKNNTHLNLALDAFFQSKNLNYQFPHRHL